MSNTQKWQIRQALPSEVEHLSGLAFRSKSSWGYSDRFMQTCLEELTVDEHYIENNPTFVIEDSRDIIGFYSLEHISASEVELSYLFVEPNFIGKGFGRKLRRPERRTILSLSRRFDRRHKKICQYSQP